MWNPLRQKRRRAALLPFVALFPLVAVLLNAAGFAAAQTRYTIDTVGGTGEKASNGAEGPALRNNIGQPFGVEIGPDGALYVTEVQNHRVRRIDLKSGEATTVAGVGDKGYSGDGGPATEAEMNEPYEIRFDEQGNLYVVEMQNHIVRCIDARTRAIRTVAGTGRAGFGGDGGPADQAQLRSPHSIALDGRGGLFIADIGNHRIRRVDLKTGRIVTVAGTGERRMPEEGTLAEGRPMVGPRALFVRGATLWIALREGHSVWAMDLDSGRLRHIAGAGSAGYDDLAEGAAAPTAHFNGPKGIAVDAEGAAFVVDTENQVIRRIFQGRVTTVAGAGPGARGYRGDGGPAVEAWFDRPHGICVAPDGAVYIGDTNNHRIRRLRAAR